MDARVKGYDRQQATGTDQQNDENVLDKSLKFEDMQVIGTLGKGSFGHVQLVKHKTSGQTYALKAISKQQIVDTHQQEHIVSEKRVMMRMNSPFLIRLYQTFRDRDRIYFLLEPVLGGELFSLLRRRR